MLLEIGDGLLGINYLYYKNNDEKIFINGISIFVISNFSFVYIILLP